MTIAMDQVSREQVVCNRSNNR